MQQIRTSLYPNTHITKMFPTIVLQKLTYERILQTVVLKSKPPTCWN